MDTSDNQKRTQELTKPIIVALSHTILSYNKERILLYKDSNGTAINIPFALRLDTTKGYKLIINPTWQDNTLYTLKLLKGFVKDTGGADALPSKFIFRSKREEDYSKLQVHVSGNYRGNKYLLLVFNPTDTVYYKPILDTIVNIVLLKPELYTLRIVIDENENGKWDTGDLMAKKQPEFILPYDNPITLKAGWDNIIDFIPTNKQNTASGKEKKVPSSDKNK